MSLLLLVIDQVTDKISRCMIHGSEMTPMEAGLTSVERLKITLLLRYGWVHFCRLQSSQEA